MNGIQLSKLIMPNRPIQFVHWETPKFHYYGARFYDPSIMRFLTEDSEGYSSILDPLSLNRYIYVKDDPERYVDPTGHMFYVPGIGGVGGSNTEQVAQQVTQILQERAQIKNTPIELDSENGIVTTSTTYVSGSTSSTITSSKNSEYPNEPPGYTCVGLPFQPGAACGVPMTLGQFGAYALSGGIAVVGGVLVVGGVIVGVGLNGWDGADWGAKPGLSVLDSGLDAWQYTYNAGTDATPQGAWNAAVSHYPGEFLQNLPGDINAGYNDFTDFFSGW